MMQASAMRQNRGFDSRKIAAHRPRCASCGDATHLFRIAPATSAAGFNVEYVFECTCGANTVLNEADLWGARA
jgi:hypothetical protein